jgi:hypothetical protein
MPHSFWRPAGALEVRKRARELPLWIQMIKNQALISKFKKIVDFFSRQVKAEASLRALIRKTMRHWARTPALPAGKFMERQLIGAHAGNLVAPFAIPGGSADSPRLERINRSRREITNGYRP